jgi:hypothetical protein
MSNSEIQEYIDLANNEASARRLVTNADDFVGQMIRFLAEHAPVDEADDATE